MPVLKFDPMSAVSLRVRKILAPSINVFAMLTLIGRPKSPPRLAAASVGGGGGAPGPPGTGGGSGPPGGGTAKAVGAAGAVGGGLGVAACAAFKSSSCFCRLRICVWYCFWIFRISFCSSLIGSFAGVAVCAMTDIGRTVQDRMATRPRIFRFLFTISPAKTKTRARKLTARCDKWMKRL